jgi:hypothetical protein
VIRTLAWMPDEDALRALRMFVKRSDISPSLLAAALYVLKRFQASGPIEVWRNGRLEQTRIEDIADDVLLLVERKWQTVWEQVEAQLLNSGLHTALETAKALWLRYLEHSFLRNETRIQKEGIWVGAVLYLVQKQAGAHVRQAEIAERLGLSVSSLRKAIARLNAIWHAPEDWAPNV